MGGKLVKPFAELCHSHKDVLEEILCNNEMPTPEQLFGCEWDGWTKPKKPWTKFKKSFLKLEDGTVIGYNTRMHSNNFNNCWTHMPGKESFGFFRVYPANEDPKANIHSNALLLNYDTEWNKDPITKATRDYVVTVPGPEGQIFIVGKMYILTDDLIKGNGGKHVPIPPYYPYFFLRKTELLLPSSKGKPRFKYTPISSAKEREIKTYLNIK